MSKGQEAKSHENKDHEAKTHEHTEKVKEAHPKGAAGHGGAEEASKKHDTKKSDSPSLKSKGHEPLPGGCFSWGCKVHAKRFNFCEEHYEQFKFGLIKKTGEPALDYEKKFEHYTAYKAKQNALKVA